MVLLAFHTAYLFWLDLLKPHLAACSYKNTHSFCKITKEGNDGLTHAPSFSGLREVQAEKGRCSTSSPSAIIVCNSLCS